MTKTTTLFTPAEASRTLPLVRRIVEDILATGQEMRSLAQEKEPTAEQVTTYEARAGSLRDLIAELEDLGCLYKDWNFSEGLVDFPAVIDGQQVLLCWRSDEPDIAFYHGYEDGFAGRKEIPAAHLVPSEVT